MTVTARPLNEAHTTADQSGHLQAHNDLGHYVNQALLKGNAPSPADGGRLLGYSFSPMFANGSSMPALTAGVLYLARIDVPEPVAVTNIELPINVPGTGATALANCYAGIYDSTGNLIGSTTEQHTSWAAGGFGGPPKVMPLTGGPFTVGGSGSYLYAGVLIGTQATTPLQLLRSTSLGNAGFLNWPFAAGTFRAATYGSAQSALPATLTLVSLTAAPDLMLVGLS